MRRVASHNSRDDFSPRFAAWRRRRIGAASAPSHAAPRRLARAGCCSSPAPSSGCSRCSRWRRTAPPIRASRPRAAAAPIAEPRRRRSAPGSPTSAFFLVGYSVWWAVLVGARAWLGALGSGAAQPRCGRRRRRRRQAAGVADAGSAWRSCSPPAPRSNGPASTSGKAQVAGGNAGGVLGARPRQARARRCSASPARACSGSPCSSPARRWRCASPGCASPTRSARRSSRCATRRVERIERAEDARLGADAMRERDEVRRGRARAAGAAPADRDRADAGRRAEEHARRQGATEAALQRARSTPSCRRSTCSTRRRSASRA